jgi:hypothetical protein
MKKGKYIDYQILLACLSKPPVQVKKEPTAETIEKLSNNNFNGTDEEKTKSIDNRKAA